MGLFYVNIVSSSFDPQYVENMYSTVNWMINYELHVFCSTANYFSYILCTTVEMNNASLDSVKNEVWADIFRKMIFFRGDYSTKGKYPQLF